jgi:hypothetical protein
MVHFLKQVVRFQLLKRVRMALLDLGKGAVETTEGKFTMNAFHIVVISGRNRIPNNTGVHKFKYID